MNTAPVNGTARHEALAAARQAAVEGVPLTGAQLAERFDRSERWGRDILAEVRAADDTLPVIAAADERQNGGNPQDTDGPSPVLSEGADLRNPIAAAEPLPRHAARQPWLDTAITLVVAAVAAAASYGHMAHVATLAGEPLWLARAFPITVDGLVLAAIRRGESGRWWLVLGLVVSVGANVLAQFPATVDQIAPAVAAWPPVALYGTHRLLHGRKDPR